MRETRYRDGATGALRRFWRDYRGALIGGTVGYWAAALWYWPLAWWDAPLFVATMTVSLGVIAGSVRVLTGWWD